MTNTILCAVDINRPRDEIRVVQTAARLADMEGAQLDLITVMPDFGMTVIGAYFQDHQVKSATAKADELLRTLSRDAMGDQNAAKVRHIVATGTVYEEVLRTARLNKADLIVIGANNPDLKDYLLGPNAARVVRHSKCSVYVVRY